MCSNLWQLQFKFLYSTIFNFYGLNRLPGVRCIHRCCSHKTFSSPTTAGLPPKLNSAQLCNHAGSQCNVMSRESEDKHTCPQSMPGTDYDSAINVHLCCNSVPGHASGDVPGMLVT